MRGITVVMALAALALLAPGTAAAQASNVVQSIAVAELADATEIRVSGLRHPSYSVYRLRNPLRLFVDIADSRVAPAVTAVDVDNGVLAQVAATTYAEDAAPVARIVLGFDQDALYDVTTEDGDLVITVDGAGRNLFVGRSPTTPDDYALLARELAAAAERAATLEAAVADADARSAALEQEMLRSNLAQARAEQERLQALADNDQMAAAVQDLEASLQQTSARVASLESERTSTERDYAQRVAQLEAERTEALRRVEQLQQDAAAAERSLSERDARIARLQAESTLAASQLSQAQARGADASELAALTAARDEQAGRLAAAERELADVQAQNARSAEALRLALEEARAAQTAQQQVIREQSAAIAAMEADAQVATGPIADIRFEHGDDVDRVIIDVPAGVQFETLPYENGRSAIRFSGTALPDHLRRTLDTQAFAGPVSFVSSYADAEGAVHVVVDLGDAAAEFLRREENRIVWEFTANAEVADSALGEPDEASYPYGDENAYETDARAANRSSRSRANTGSGGSSAGYRGSAAARPENNPVADLPYLQRPVMTRKRITIDLRDADIQNVIRLIADEGNINVVAGAGVGGRVTVRLRSVPLDDALMVILRSQGLGWQQTGNILRVAPLAEFSDAYNSAQMHRDTAWRREPLSVRLVPIAYADAAEISSLVQGVLSERGRLVIDRRNNALIVTDLAENLATAEALIARVDTQTPQILIEARIVETNDQFRRQLGIQWGGDFLSSQGTGNATGLLFPSTVGIAGGATDGTTPTAGTSSQPNFAVNLPAPAGTGEGGAVGFTLGSLSGAFNLNVRLSAAENQGTLKVVSAPRIMTTDNTAASITSGVSVPVQVVSAAGAQTVFFDASLTLNVVPRVTPDGNVFLTVRISKNEPDFENTGARGDPSIIRREASTELLVRDGDTTVIGGIFQRNTGFSNSRVPFLGNLPVIGPLFRSSSQTDVRNELLVFITPRIVNRELSIGSLSSSGELESPPSR